MLRLVLWSGIRYGVRGMFIVRLWLALDIGSGLGFGLGLT